MLVGEVSQTPLFCIFQCRLRVPAGRFLPGDALRAVSYTHLNYNVEVHAYVKNGKYCVVNNTYEPQDTTVYTTDGSSFALHLDANEIKWYEI